MYMVIFMVVLFSEISRVNPHKNFHFNIIYMAIYSNENITKIAKLSPSEFPLEPSLIHKNICTQNIRRMQYLYYCGH